MRAQPLQHRFAAARRFRNRLALVAAVVTLVATGVVALPARSDLRADISDRIQSLTEGRAEPGWFRTVDTGHPSELVGFEWKGASAGAVEHLRIARVRNLADFLADAKEAGCWCYGADGASPTRYDEPDYAGGVVLVLGGEGTGLRPRVAGACDGLVSLPQRGRVQSLNASAAAAVLMYGIVQRRPSP